MSYGRSLVQHEGRKLEAKKPKMMARFWKGCSK